LDWYKGQPVTHGVTEAVHDIAITNGLLQPLVESNTHINFLIDNDNHYQYI
jgi:hypothetical protein